MKKSIRFLNKKLLDSLIVNENKVKENIARVTAMILSLFLLFGTVGGPILGSIWSIATESIEYEEEVKQKTEEAIKSPSREPEPTPGPPPSEPEPTPEPSLEPPSEGVIP